MRNRPAQVSDFIPFDWRGFLAALIWYGLELVGLICLMIVVLAWWIATPGDIL